MNVEEYLRTHAVLDPSPKCDGEWVPMSVAMLAVKQYITGKLDYQEPSWQNRCPGCRRVATHKVCPAHGTPFYMSGVPFTFDIAFLYWKRVKEGGVDPDSFFQAAKMLYELGAETEEKDEFLEAAQKLHKKT